MKISKVTIFKGTIFFFKFREILVSFGKKSFVKFWSVSERSVSRNFGRFHTKRNSLNVCNLRSFNCLSRFKSIINENQQNYTSLKGLFANLLWSFDFSRNSLLPKLPKFCEISRTFDRNLLKRFATFRWFRNFGANPSYESYIRFKQQIIFFLNKEGRNVYKTKELPWIITRPMHRIIPEVAWFLFTISILNFGLWGSKKAPTKSKQHCGNI